MLLVHSQMCKRLTVEQTIKRHLREEENSRESSSLLVNMPLQKRVGSMTLWNAALTCAHELLESVRHQQLNSLGENVKSKYIPGSHVLSCSFEGAAAPFFFFFPALISRNSDMWVSVPQKNTLHNSHTHTDTRTHTRSSQSDSGGNFSAVIQKHAEEYNVTVKPQMPQRVHLNLPPLQILCIVEDNFTSSVGRVMEIRWK